MSSLSKEQELFTEERFIDAKPERAHNKDTRERLNHVISELEIVLKETPDRQTMTVDELLKINPIDEKKHHLYTRDIASSVQFVYKNLKERGFIADEAETKSLTIKDFVETLKWVKDELGPFELRGTNPLSQIATDTANEVHKLYRTQDATE